jgi:hypothetical protein
VHHHQGAVLTRAILRGGIKEAAGRIQQRINIAVDPDSRYSFEYDNRPSRNGFAILGILRRA